MRYFRIKNFETFQHYKDRDPPWIKLHRTLLSDYEFTKLPDYSKAHLMLIWVLGSQTGGRIPDDPEFVASKIGAKRLPDLRSLSEAGWLIPESKSEPEVAQMSENPEQIDPNAEQIREKWASRYVSAATREAVLARAGHKCLICAATQNLEIDHIVPVSQGGTGDESNLQCLCRPCNRRKRMRTADYGSAEQVATQTQDGCVAIARSREERTRTTETEERRARANGLGAEPIPTQTHRDLAKRFGLDCDYQWEKFCDHEWPKGKEPKDKSRGFRNWLRKAHEFAVRDGKQQRSDRPLDWGKVV